MVPDYLGPARTWSPVGPWVGTVRSLRRRASINSPLPLLMYPAAAPGGPGAAPGPRRGPAAGPRGVRAGRGGRVGGVAEIQSFNDDVKRPMLMSLPYATLTHATPRHATPERAVSPCRRA